MYSQSFVSLFVYSGVFSTERREEEEEKGASLFHQEKKQTQKKPQSEITRDSSNQRKIKR